MFDDIDLSEGEDEPTPTPEPAPAPEPAKNNAPSDDDLDDWETAEDPEEKAARLAAEEAARKQKEKEEKEARLAAKEEKKRQDLERKRLRKEMLEASDDEGGLFSVEIAQSKQERMDFEAAKDTFGVNDAETIDVDKIDIGTARPATVPELNAYVQAVAKKIRAMEMVQQPKQGKKNLASLVCHLIRGLCDDYKSVEIKGIHDMIFQTINDRLGKRPTKGTSQAQKGRVLVVNDDYKNHDDFDDDE